MVDEMHKEITNFQAYIATGIVNIQHSSFQDAQKPSKFKREHSTKWVDNFLYPMEKYLLLMQIKEDKIKVSTSPSYLV